MDGTILTLFLIATFAGGITNGLAGFALGLVVSGIWLHILTPLQTASLIIGYGLLVQSFGVWKLRHALNWRRVLPFIIGGTFGVPIGALLLVYINPAHLRIGVGVLLVLYSSYSLARPALKPIHGGTATETGVGVINGLVGGMTGLAGVVITIWCQLRGWPKDQQRATFQPIIFTAFIMSAGWRAAGGAVTAETTRLFLYGLPVLLAGSWLGYNLYGRLDEARFRKVVLILLLISGIVLIVPAAMFR